MAKLPAFALVARGVRRWLARGASLLPGGGAVSDGLWVGVGGAMEIPGQAPSLYREPGSALSPVCRYLSADARWLTLLPGDFRCGQLGGRGSRGGTSRPRWATRIAQSAQQGAGKRHGRALGLGMRCKSRSPSGAERKASNNVSRFCGSLTACASKSEASISNSA